MGIVDSWTWSNLLTRSTNCNSQDRELQNLSYGSIAGKFYKQRTITPMGKEQFILYRISRMFMHSNISGWKQNPHIQPPSSHDIVTSHFQRSYIDLAQSCFPGRGKVWPQPSYIRADRHPVDPRREAPESSYIQLRYTILSVRECIWINVL